MLKKYHVKYQAKSENIEKNKAIFYKSRGKSAKYYTHSEEFHATIKENFLSTAPPREKCKGCGAQGADWEGKNNLQQLRNGQKGDAENNGAALAVLFLSDAFSSSEQRRGSR